MLYTKTFIYSSRHKYSLKKGLSIAELWHKGTKHPEKNSFLEKMHLLCRGLNPGLLGGSLV
jgi:hypothetical protein